MQFYSSRRVPLQNKPFKGVAIGVSPCINVCVNEWTWKVLESDIEELVDLESSTYSKCKNHVLCYFENPYKSAVLYNR